MRCTVLCLLNDRGLDEFVFSSRREADEFYRQNIKKKKYTYIFIYTEVLENE